MSKMTSELNKKHSASSYKTAGSEEDHFMHIRRRSNKGACGHSDVSKLPPAIQVWSEDDSSSSGDVKTEPSSDDDELQLTPKGSYFISSKYILHFFGCF